MTIGTELAELTAGIDALYRRTPRSDGFLDKEGLIPVAMAEVTPTPSERQSGSISRSSSRYIRL